MHNAKELSRIVVVDNATYSKSVPKHPRSNRLLLGLTCFDWVECPFPSNFLLKLPYINGFTAET